MLVKIGRYMLGAVAAMAAIAVLAVMLADTFSFSSQPNTTDLLIFTGIAILFLETAFVFLRQTWQMKESNADVPKDTLFSDIGYLLRIRYTLFLVIPVILFSFMLMLSLHDVAVSSVRFTPAFITLISILLGYVLIRPLVIRFFKTKIAPSLRKTLPSYILQEDTVTIDLQWSGKKVPAIQVSFAELSEIRELTLAEATEMKESLGPDVALAAREMKGMFQFTKGDIPRPPVYFAEQSLGSTALLYGPEVHYIITFSNDVKPLVDAFRNYKTQR